ncbi:hemicentin-1-like isoform X3 [Aquarana catesbeiana]|uniref:hemicentin-1-like isoform X3 n=1 Tax=Aquarana catesbeiana TaxID=8400 RepID=UPI003CC9F310
MAHIGVGPVCALLLLIQYGNGADLIITSPDPSPTIRTGDLINLTISYSSTPSLIMWTANGSLVVLWLKGEQFPAAKYKSRLTLQEKRILLNDSTTEDSGEYTVKVIDTNGDSGNFTFNVVVRDIITDVTLLQTPAIVIESTPMVNLSCRASSGSGSVTWQKDGQPLTNDSSHVLLDQALQILNPNRTFSGNYSCNMSNPVSWNVGSKVMTVYFPVESVTVTQSLQVVSESSPAVNLSCSTPSGNSEAVTWTKDGQPIINNSTHILMNGNKILQITAPKRTFSGLYSCNMSNAAYWSSGSLLLRVYDPVVNVKMTQSPQKVNEGAALVNLSCSASSGFIERVTWMKDGQSVISKNAYSLLDGNWTLQITRPDRTFNGLYICNISNAAYWGSGSLNLTVSYATPSATSTYSMLIITLLGGILLAH